ncbi:maestro heat-like repeat-containing protein family member 1 [Perognathus longimembris pacificus]|uniref:maestro heat-like repeat-containing protein family member 1 n=1 Tax=Perognathus longimembris pacificus TaxID=214514 RepID=UPI0020185D0B|nr:maestro heat-like repeat-containing protein family member 1 [Perognathus longimembris pacificus]
MPAAMAERTEDWVILGKSMEYIMEALQVPGQLSPREVLDVLKLLAVRILNNKMSGALCQKMTDIIINYLRKAKPEEELEEMGAVVLTALGSHYPGAVIIKLLDRSRLYRLPPRSLLVAVGKLNLSPGAARLHRGDLGARAPAAEGGPGGEGPAGAVPNAGGLAVNAHQVREPQAGGRESTDAAPQFLSLKACLTLRVLFHRWPLTGSGKVTEQALVIAGRLFFLIAPSKLRTQVNWLVRRLVALTATPARALLHLPVPLPAPRCPGAERLWRRQPGVPGGERHRHAVPAGEQTGRQHGHSFQQSHSLAMRGFYILTKLYNKEVVVLLLKTLVSKDLTKVLFALQVFQKVFREVTQTEFLKAEVMKAVIVVIQECGQEDPPRPAPPTCHTAQVRMALLNFLEILAELGYLLLPQGGVLIAYILRLSSWDLSHEEDMQLRCLRILKMLPLPKLVTFACQSAHLKSFLVLSEAATEIALQNSALGHFPYLSRFHRKPTQITSPQTLLTQLVLFALKPFRQKEFGVRSLKLLSALHPITSLHPVINSCVGQLWKKAIPEMLQILEDYDEKNLNQRKWEHRLLQFSSQSLVAISDDAWMEQLTVGVLGRVTQLVGHDEEKAFLYRFLGYTMSTTNNPQLVKKILWSILNTSHEELLEREGIAEAFSIVSLRHLQVVLDEVREFGTRLTDCQASPILGLVKELQQKEWGLVCSTMYFIYGKIILENPGAIFQHVDGVLALTLQHYQDCIVEKARSPHPRPKTSSPVHSEERGVHRGLYWVDGGVQGPSN